MKSRKITDQELDAVAKGLLFASRLTEAEIDRIASGSDLFDGVRKRISAQKPVRKGRRSFRWAVFSAPAAILVVFAGSALILQPSSTGNVYNSGSVSTDPGTGRTHSSSENRKGVYALARAAFLDESQEPQDIPTKPTVEHAIRREVRRPQPRVERASYATVEENHFVAVTYVGEEAESTRGGRVVRVDVPRSTLFAMGFNVSLENESPTVTADLLIGPDGVTRAIRLVE